MDFNEGFLGRIEHLARLSVPYALMAGLFLMSFISVPEPLSFILKAPFILMVLYYWSLFRPTLLPYWLVFLAGLCVDLLSGFPVGLHALLFIACRAFVSSQRRFLIGQTFMMIWLGYVLVSIAFTALQWFALSLISLNILPIAGVMYEGMQGVVIFPVVLLMLHVTHKILPTPQADMARTLKENRTGQGF